MQLCKRREAGHDQLPIAETASAIAEARPPAESYQRNIDELRYMMSDLDPGIVSLLDTLATEEGRTREEILEAGQEDIRALADVAEAVLAAGQVCVIGSEEKIEEEKEMFGEVTSF